MVAVSLKKNFTFDTFIDRMRECFIDMGPNDQMTETRKVSKLMAAWQVPSLQHLSAIVLSNPQCKHDFEASVTFLSGQLSHQVLRCGGWPGRNASTTATGGGDDGCGNATDTEDAKDAKEEAQPSATNGFDPEDPGAYVPADVWRQFTPEQKEAARKAREEQGIPTRGVSYLTGAGSSDWSDSDDETRDFDRMAAQGDDALVEGTDCGGGALDEDSLRALENVIRQATQLLEAARPKKRRKTGGH